jgi:hypothetical protein
MMKKAVSEGKLEIVKVLKNQGVSLSFKNEMEQSLLHISHPGCHGNKKVANDVQIVWNFFLVYIKLRWN